MNITILVDKNSMASNNIKDKLINRLQIFEETNLEFENNKILKYISKDGSACHLITTETRSIACEHFDKKIESETKLESDLMIFATTHTSKSQIPSLSVHSIGNWDKAELGGEDRTLVKSADNFLKDAFRYMNKNYQKYDSIKNFDIIQEVTHHGPNLSTPTMFIEIGSSETEWAITEAGLFIAETIQYILDNANQISSEKYKTYFGIGGQHTASNFKKIMINDQEITIGHICPKYMLKSLDKSIIIQAMKQSTKESQSAIIDWKSMGDEKQRIIQILEENNIPFKKTKEFKYN